MWVMYLLRLTPKVYPKLNLSMLECLVKVLFYYFYLKK